MKNKNILISFIIISISICTYLAITYTYNSKNEYINISKKNLFQEALSLYNNIVNTRKWSSDHGGVYVVAHEGIEPNPYLKDNHTYTEDGKLLIKINPAWMTRQISEISNKKEKYFFRITSLQPINPNNIPDDFEKRALLFLKNKKEQIHYTELTKENYNFFGSLKVEPSCIKCHTTQNYVIGDTIGGLRISLPINNYNEKFEIIDSKTNILYLSIIVTALFFIALIIYIINSFYKREKNALELNRLLEKKVDERTKELTKANEKLTRISTIDYLTNIPNRRYFFEIGKKAFHLAKRQKEELSIICLDIDLFKNINDTYGHQTGDEILKHVSKIMNENIRKSDILARTGGEEFTILLNNTNSNGAFVLAEKIRKSVKNTPYENEEIKIKTTMSLGVSQIELDDSDLDSVIAKADKALYKAKKEGRNKTLIYE